MSGPLFDFDQTLAESRTMQGALGAIAYTVLKALQVSGADPKTIASVRVLLEDQFLELSDEQCNVLCDVVFTRLGEEAKQEGPWY